MKYMFLITRIAYWNNPKGCKSVMAITASIEKGISYLDDMEKYSDSDYRKVEWTIQEDYAYKFVSFHGAGVRFEITKTKVI